MGYIGNVPSAVPLTSSDLADSIVSNSKLGADSVNSSKISDDSISEEHIDNTAITGFGALTSLADTDKFLVSDASDSNNLKYVENQYLGGGSYVHLGTVESTNNDTIISVADKFTTTYDFYIWFCQWKQTTDGTDTRFRFLSSGTNEISGSHYITTADRHQVNSSNANAHDIDHTAYAQNYSQITNNLPAQGSNFHTLQLTFWNPMKATPIDRAKVTGMKSYVRTDDVWRGGTIAIEYKSGDSANTYAGFKIWPSSGYMTNYTWQLYGLKKS